MPRMGRAASSSLLTRRCVAAVPTVARRVLTLAFIKLLLVLLPACAAISMLRQPEMLRAQHHALLITRAEGCAHCAFRRRC